MPSRRPALVLLASGAALTVVGVVILVRARSTGFGWFAYAPLTEETFVPGPLMQPAHIWGAALGIAGLVAASWAAGYLAGRRDQRRP